MSILKIITPGSQEFGDVVATLIKRGSRGRLIGNDRSLLEKRAGAQFLYELDKIPRDPGEELIHLLAVGSTEKFGMNRNGDGFREAALRRTHPTFVKYGRFYRDHLNKDPSKSYGIVKLSAYHEPMSRVELICALNATKEAAERNGGLLADREMEKLARGDDIAVSMACALAGTLVKLRRGFTPVEAIVPGDEVLTHRGRYRPVYAAMQREKPSFVRIETEYYGRQVLEFTPDHEFYVGRWKDIPRSKSRNGLRSADRSGFSRNFRKKYRDQLHASARWLPCGELASGDLLLMPIYRGDGSATTDVKRARLLGYYVAEGSRTGDGYLCYTCNKADALPEELPQLTTASISENPHSASDEAINVMVYDKPLTSTITAAVGCGVRNKVIPQEIYDATADIKLEFVAAWFNGDGWQDGKGLHWSTCSRGLSIELQMLLASIGIPASVYRIDHTSDLPHGLLRTGDGIEYTINVSNRFSGMFAGRSKAAVRATQTGKTTVFITGDYLAIPVKAVTTVVERTPVYDISVEEDESFTAFGLAVHNCRVPFDVCSYCGNQAPTRNQYCHDVADGGLCKAGGLSKNIGRTVQVDGDTHQLHADNTEPTFFDISHVFRPADRIAYVSGVLQKAASAGHVVSGAELAEALGLTVPYTLMIEQELPAKTAELLKLAFRMADLEQTTSAENAKLAFAASVQPPIAMPPGGREKFAQVLRALADIRCMLTPRDFVRLVTDYDEKQAAAVADVVTCYLPCAFTRMTQDQNLPSMLQTNPYSPAPSATQDLHFWAEKQASAISLAEPHFTRRLHLAAFRNERIQRGDVQQAEKLAAVGGPAAELAKQYCLYQLAFLQSIPNPSHDFPLTAQRVSLHNHAR
jgi:hypothetical protein